MGMTATATAVSPSTYSAPTRTPIVDRVPELDLLRFIAASAVVVYHLMTAPIIGGRPDLNAFGITQAFVQFGFLGVHLFFMLSGFVILWSSENRSAGQFVLSRIARLYPSFWVCMLLTALVLTVLGNFYAPSLRTVLVNLTMVPTQLGVPAVDGVYWTLWVEMRFYLLVFIVLVTGTMQHVERWIGVWLIACIAAAAGWAPRWLQFIAMAPLAAFFISGCLFYLIRSRGPSVFRIGAVIASCALCALDAVHEQNSFIHGTRYPVGTMTTVVIVSAIVAFHLAMFAIALKPSILPASRKWYILGSLTYPLYLLHNMIGKAFGETFDGRMPFVVSLVLRFAIVYGMAAVVAAVIERRGCSAFHRALQRAATRFRIVRLRPA
jgi:peptidoglycan/LPS O-acetylase OafA/YrhL